MPKQRATSAPDEPELIRLYNQHGGNISNIAAALKRPRSTVTSWYKRLDLTGTYGSAGVKVAEKPVELPEFADDDIEVPEIIDMMCKRFDKRHAYQKQKDWFPIKVNDKKPIAISFVGDPHVDDNGCNWPLLKRHCDLHANTDGLYAVNIGDTENAWAGRLIKKYADQDTSRDTAHKLSEWFLNDSGIDWLVWLMGNHDLWTELPALFRAKNVKNIPMEDWQARFKLVFPNGRECKIWTAHDFRGHSMWNSLHAPQKTAHMKSEANIYACGHTHNWAIHQEESASRDFTYWLVRSRGYKFIDEYADLLGHFPQQEGASITCIIDPNAKSASGFIQAYADMEKAVDYLNFLRRS